MVFDYYGKLDERFNYPYMQDVFNLLSQLSYVHISL